MISFPYEPQRWITLWARVAAYEHAERARVTAPRQLRSFFFRIIVATTGVRLCARVRLTWTWLVWRALTGLNDLLRIWQTASAVTQTGCEALRTWREWQWLTSAALHASSTSTLLSPLNGVSVNESSATISCSDPLCWEAAVSPPFPLCLPRAHTPLSCSTCAPHPFHPLLWRPLCI